MRFTSSELPADVEEDGTREIIDTNKKLDKMARCEKPVLTDRNGVVDEKESNRNMATMNGNSPKMPEVNGCSSKQPVENAASDSEDNSSGEKDSEENDDLSESLSKCSISSKGSSSKGSSTGKVAEQDDLAGKISNLSIKDETDKEDEPRDEEQFIEIKSSDITTPEEIERRRKEDADKMNERGPTGGVATNFCPNQPRYNQTAMKSYPESFYKQLNGGYGYNQHGDDTVSKRVPTGVATNYMNQSQYNQVAMTFTGARYEQLSKGLGYNPHTNDNLLCQQRPIDQFQQSPQIVSKRTRDDFDEQPAKFTRPVETEFNNLSNPSKTQTPNMTFSNVVSSQRLCGGHVAIKSPDVEPLSGFVPFAATTSSGDFELAIFTDETYQDCAINTDPLGLDTSKCEVNQPYQNDVHHTNTTLGSQNVYLEKTHLNLAAMDSFRRQNGHENRTSFSDPDGLSEGYISDVASPFSEPQDSPPAADQSMYSPPPSNISVDSGTCVSTVPSPGSQMDTCSPRSTQTGYESNMDVYSPHSPFNPLSPPGVGQNMQNMTQNIPAMGPNIQTSQNCLPQGCPPNMNMSAPEYPVSVQSNVASVQPIYSSTGYSQNGHIPDLGKLDDMITSEFIDENLANLKDVMETIAHDMIQTEKKRKPSNTAAGSAPQTVPKQNILPQQRPLPASQPQQGRPVASVSPSQSQKLLTSVPTTSAPIMLIKQPQNLTTVPVCRPNIITSSQPNGIPVTTSQILVIPAQPQPAPTFVIVTPQAPQVKRPTKYRNIQPKIQANPPPGKGNAVDSKHVAPSPSPKSVSPHKSVQPVCSTAPVPTAQPAKCTKGQSQAPRNNVNQLNIARRLVANMTTDDLKFTDKDGDTFLHVGVCRADKYMVQALLERIVRENLQHMIDTQNSERQTPVYLAVSANQPEMVDLFNKYGADVNLLAERISPNGQKEVKAAIHSAVSSGSEYLLTLQALLKAPDLNLNMFNSDGCTALHCAILEHNQPRHEAGSSINSNLLTNSKPIIEALIRAGADPNSQDKKSGKTAFMYALESSDYTLVETLLGLVDSTKVRSYFRTQAFDGSTCVKIIESRKSEFPHSLYEKLTGIMSNNRNALNHRRVNDVA